MRQRRYKYRLIPEGAKYEYRLILDGAKGGWLDVRQTRYEYRLIPEGAKGVPSCFAYLWLDVRQRSTGY